MDKQNTTKWLFSPRMVGLLALISPAITSLCCIACNHFFSGKQIAQQYVGELAILLSIVFLLVGIGIGLIAHRTNRWFSSCLAAREDALRAAEMKYRGLHESILDAVVQIDLEGHIVDCNRAFEEMIGYERQELQTKSIYDLSPEKWHGLALKIFKTQVSQRGCYDIHRIEYIHKDGSTFPVELRMFLLRDAARNAIGSWAIVRDISERNAAEERASRNEHIFRTLISSLPQKILLKDKDSRIVYCNENYAADMGLTVEQVIGKSDHDLYAKETAESHIRSDQEAISKGGTVELFFRTQEGGREHITRALKTVVKNEVDQVSGILCVFEDFTERIKAEEAIRSANHELEETNRQLGQMQSQLVRSEKLASIGQLAAGIAHEINNPMGFVTNNLFSLRKYLANVTSMYKGYEELIGHLKDKTCQDVDPEIQAIVAKKNELQIDYIFEDIPGLFEDSMQGVQQIIKIVKTLRDFSRVDRLEDFAYCDIAEGIRSTLIVAANELKYAADIVTDLAQVPEVYCNIGQLNQVFLNMLVNAAQAIKEQNRKGKIEIQTLADEEFVTCLIRDDGPGIAPENMSKIFDPFFTTKPVGKGTGLGLNVSYDIVVNKHKGQLLVDSEVGKGTRFTIRIPRNLEQLMNAKEEENGRAKNHLVRG